MAILARSYGDSGGIAYWFYYDDTPLALAEPDATYTERFEVRRVRVRNLTSNTYRFLVRDPRFPANPPLNYDVIGGADFTSPLNGANAVPRNTYYMLSGPEGMSPPDYEGPFIVG